jgi:uncharacterized membrane protein (DUF373 family)
MTLVILWGVLDVAWVLYRKLMEPPFMMLTISDILDTFGAFMAVLIAIEIFVNISIYLREDIIHVKIVMATALMAIARKVIILDFTRITPDYIWAIAGVVIAMSIGYWLVVKVKDEDIEGISCPGEARSLKRDTSAERAAGKGRNEASPVYQANAKPES